MIDPSEQHFCLQMRTAPQRERFDPQSAQRARFAFAKCAPRHSESAQRVASRSQNVHRATANHSESDSTPKVRRGLASRSQNVHRATARAISLSQKVTCLPRNLHPGAKVLRLPRNLHEKLQSAAPATKFNQYARKCCACHAK